MCHVFVFKSLLFVMSLSPFVTSLQINVVIHPMASLNTKLIIMYLTYQVSRKLNKLEYSQKKEVSYQVWKHLYIFLFFIILGLFFSYKRTFHFRSLLYVLPVYLFGSFFVFKNFSSLLSWSHGYIVGL